MRRMGITLEDEQTPRLRRSFISIALVTLLAPLAGCLQEQIEANARELQAQHAELDKLKQEVQALSQTQYPVALAPAGACDAEVMRKATMHGGESLAAGNFKQALGYYQDATMACPSSAEAELNLARAYEALGDRDAARDHYTRAEASGSKDPTIARQARDALARLSTAK